MVDDGLHGRSTPRRLVTCGVSIGDEGDVIAPDEGAVQRTAHARIGFRADDDQPADAALGQRLIQRGRFERVSVGLLDDGFAVGGESSGTICQPSLP